MGLKSTVPNSLAQPGVCTSITRPLAPYEGQIIYETDTDNAMVWNGSAWIFIHDGAWTAKGDLFVGTADSDGDIIGVGANNTLLTADNSTPTGLAWKSDINVTSVTTNVLSAADITGAISGQIIINAVNNTASTLTKGSIVYISGVNASATPEVELCDYNISSTLPPAGLVFADITAGQIGHVVVFGLVSGLDTSAFAANTQLWMDPAGGLSVNQPMGPAEDIYTIGRVVVSDATNGSILVTSGIPKTITPNTISVDGPITTALSITSDTANVTTHIYGLDITATGTITGANLAATNSLTVNSVEIDPTGADIDEVLVFNGTKFVPANIDTGGKAFAYFMGA